MLIPNPSENGAQDGTPTNLPGSSETTAPSEAVAPEAQGDTFRATIPPINFAGIPNLLKSHPHWVLWRLTQREGKGKLTKVPFHSDGRRADVTDVSACESFDVVKARYEAGEVAGVRFDGLGFVLTRALGIVGVDMDKQRLPDGTWSAAVVEQIAALQTYGEASPSGVGVRFFGLGTLPEKGRKRGDFEIYNGGRYLTVTGHKLEGVPGEIVECDAALQAFHAKHIAPATKAQEPSDFFSETPFASKTARAETAALSDEELLGRIGKSRKAGKFRALWDGDDSAYKGDVSAADLGFCNKLAFWTGKDAARMDRMFRQSKRMRSKWDERHGSDGRTYGQSVIQLAIESCGDIYDPTPFAFSALKAEDVPEPAGKDRKGNAAYGAHQIAKLLYPHWSVAALSTNAAHAWRLREHLGEDLRYTPKLGWLHFNGKFWEVDDKESTRTAAIVAGLSAQIRAEATHLYNLVGLLASAGRQTDADAMALSAKEHSPVAMKVEDRRFVTDTLHFACGQSDVRVDIKLFDPKPWVLGFENGVWDFGVWREHRREDFFLHVCPVEIDFAALSAPVSNSNSESGTEQEAGAPEAAAPEAAAPEAAAPGATGGTKEPVGEWATVLDRISNGDADLERTLQDLAGYILSGASHLRYIPWAYGGKGTGKSTYSMLLQTMLGLHSKTISPSDLGKNTDRDRLGVKLWNKRLVVCAEAGFQQIEPELLKTMSGGDMMSVRFFYKEAFDALPYHVILLVANDPPRLDAYDEALKDRIIALPFVHHLKVKGHLHLTGGERLEDVRRYPDAVLVREFAVWALQGLARVMDTQEVFVAPAVEAATEKFWVDTDPLTPFWETIPVDLLNEGIFKKRLRSKYEAWCESSSIRPFTNIPWNRACLSIGLVECRRTKASIKAWVLEPKSPFGSAPQAAGNVVPGNAAPGGTKQPQLNIYGDEIEAEETMGCGSSASVNIEDLLA